MDNDQILIEAWKQTIAVQMHFNDLELRIRAFGLTAIAAILGLAGLDAANANILVLAAAIVIWPAFFLMEILWYHPFLKAAVMHGQAIEELPIAPNLDVDWPPIQETDERGEPMLDENRKPKLKARRGSLLGLTHRISFQSSNNPLHLHSTQKMFLYYLIVWGTLWIIVFASRTS